MQVDYIKEDKYQLQKLQASLFGEVKEVKVILVYKSRNYRDLLKNVMGTF